MKTIGVIVICLLFGGIGIFVGRLSAQPKKSEEQIKADIDQYPFISKRILQYEQNDLILHFVPLRKDLREYSNDFGDDFAFYFEYLPTGTSIGINEKNEYSPQSLIKVPLVMALYHWEEKSGMKMDKTIGLTKEQLDNRFGDLWKKGVGYKLTLDEAAKLALIESDDTAAKVLADNVPLDDYVEVYEGLDIPFPGDNSKLKLSAKQYSSILKSLYFASILSKENSEKILELMAQSRFNDKLKKPIPSDVKVANKIGVLGDELFQDCGIVYFPKRPYLLCMISKSTEIVARERMDKVSQLVFDFISK